MLVMVVSLFAICWGPILIDSILTSFGYLDAYNYGALKYTRPIMALMSYANSCINPIVYAFMSANFRNSFRRALSPVLPQRMRHCQQRSPTYGYRNDMTSYTNIPSVVVTEPSKISPTPSKRFKSKANTRTTILKGSLTETKIELIEL